MDSTPPFPSAARRPVLYVEDNAVNAMLLQALFEHQRPDLQLVVAGSGQEAIGMMQRLRPCLLLLDLRLPDCHGGALLPVLRLVGAGADPPAIAVTADGVFDIEGTGFAELWIKPLDLARVLQRLEQLLGPVAAPPAMAEARADAKD